MSTQQDGKKIKSTVRTIIEIVAVLASIATIVSLYIQKQANDEDATKVALLEEQRNFMATVAASGGDQVSLLATQNAINIKILTLAPSLPTIQVVNELQPTLASTPIVSLPTSTIIPNTPSPIPQISAIDGVWDVQVIADRIEGNDGIIKSVARSAKWVITLNQSGEFLNGELIGAIDACKDANISGTVINNQVEFIVHYVGSCCPNEKMKFAGTLYPDNNLLTGNIEPVNIPTSNCELWFANITANKR